MRVTPYDTGRVKIGIHYHPAPKPLRLSRTETMLQASMLKSKQAKQVTERPTDWDGIVIVGVCIAVIVIVYAWLWSSI